MLLEGEQNLPRKYPQYRLRGEKLFRSFGKERYEASRLVVLLDQRLEVLNKTHDVIEAGHLKR